MISKGARLPKYSDEVISQRILVRCLKLQEEGLLPTIRNIGAVGCNRDRILKIRNILIYEGLIALPANKLGTLVRHPMNPYLDPPATADDPAPDERQAIEDRIQATRETKKLESEIYRSVEIKVCRSTLKIKSSGW